MPSPKPYIGARSLTTLNYQPRLLAYINGHYIPATSIDCDLSAYGTADAYTVKAYFHGLYTELGNVSILRESQIAAGNNKPLEMIIYAQVGDSSTTRSPLAFGYLDKISIDTENDEIVFHGRGLTSLLLDPKITASIKNGTSVEAAIRDICKRYNLNVVITATSGLTVGKVMKDDFVTNARNLSAFAFVQTLCNAVGWDIRARGATLVVGPPPNPNTVLSLSKEWGASTGGIKLAFEHDAFHSHNVKVRIISYHQGTKKMVVGKGSAQGPYAAGLGMAQPAAGTAKPTSQQGPYAAGLGMATPLATGGTKKGRGTRGGRVSGYSGTDPRPSAREEIYVMHVHGLDQHTADVKAKQMADAIARREFRATLEWAPDADELIKLAGAGCEFSIRLSGVDDPVLNNAYFPQEMKYAWSVHEGLLATAHLLNHPTPQDEQGVA